MKPCLNLMHTLKVPEVPRVGKLDKRFVVMQSISFSCNRSHFHAVDFAHLSQSLIIIEHVGLAINFQILEKMNLQQKK